MLKKIVSFFHTSKRPKLADSQAYKIIHGSAYFEGSITQEEYNNLLKQPQQYRDQIRKVDFQGENTFVFVFNTENKSSKFKTYPNSYPYSLKPKSDSYKNVVKIKIIDHEKISLTFLTTTRRSPKGKKDEVKKEIISLAKTKLGFCTIMKSQQNSQTSSTPLENRPPKVRRI